MALLGVVGCASTCSDSTQSSTAIGELGNGDFIYTCVGRNDPACGFNSFDATDNSFPECIVLGGRFRLAYNLRDASAASTDLAPFITVESGNDAYFSGTDSFTARKIGRSVFLAREEDQVLDFIHMRVVGASAVQFFDPSGNITDRIEVPMGDRKEVKVRPTGAPCTLLGGAMPMQATTADSSVATAIADDILEIYGAGVGSTTLLVHLGEPGEQSDLTGALTVVVTESVGTTDSTGTGTATSDTEGTGTDTATGTGSTGTGGTEGTGDSTSDSSTGGSTGSTGG